MNSNSPEESENPYRPSAIEPETTPERELETGPFHPFKTIWIRPRKTLHSILARDPKLHVILLASLAGIGDTLNRASVRNLGDDLPLIWIFVMALLFGPVAGLIGLWIGAHLIRLAGNFMGGIGDMERIRAAIAWAGVPSIFALVIWVPQLLFLGTDLFTEQMPRLAAEPMLRIPYFGLLAVEQVFAIWGMVLLCNTVAEAQGYRSAWRGLGNLLLPVVVILGPVVVIIILLVIASRT